jgi:hypothetical protein
MDFSADNAEYLSDFGVIAQGGTCTLNGLPFDGIFNNAESGGMAGMMIGTNPTFTCLTSAAGNAPRGQVLVVNGMSYTVREAKPDGTDFTLLELEAA